jgi:hypothetical protein
MKRFAFAVAFAATTTLGLLALSAPASAQSRLEEILRNPVVQQLLGSRAPELRTEAQLCANAQFKAANPARCQAAADAARMAAIPFELRTVLTNPASAAALRQLCVTAPVDVGSTNYLCVELGKGDASLGTEIQQRAFQQSMGDQRP